jgi:hypothetical protein
MPALVEADFAVGLRAGEKVGQLNADSTAGLFTNAITPDPSTLYGGFSAATYPGYGTVDLAGQWGTAVQVVPGQWQTTTNVFQFPSPSGGGSVTIYGCYVFTSGTQMLCSYLFAGPLVVNPGDPPILCQVNYNFWARVLLP